MDSVARSRCLLCRKVEGTGDLLLYRIELCHIDVASIEADGYVARCLIVAGRIDTSVCQAETIDAKVGMD